MGKSMVWYYPQFQTLTVSLEKMYPLKIREATVTITYFKGAVF